MAVLVSNEYRAEADALLDDPIIVAMAKGLAGEDFNDITHPDGTPRFAFMMAANAEYKARGGKSALTIGSVAHALIANLG